VYQDGLVHFIIGQQRSYLKGSLHNVHYWRRTVQVGYKGT